jgi:CDGSH-type Zn-finger protein
MANNKNYLITIVKNGPYIIAGGLPLIEEIIVVDKEGFAVAWKQGKRFSDKEKYQLCRCGKSKNMPYCDGAHVKAGFDGTETAGHKPFAALAEKTTGPELILDDVIKLCALARFCTKDGGIWDLTERSDDPAAKQTAIQQAWNCPAGRLVVGDKKTGGPIEPALEPSISLVEDPQKKVSGPIWVKGGVPVVSADGKKYEIRNRVTLCRCGKSRNKPFCDGAHVHL